MSEAQAAATVIIVREIDAAIEVYLLRRSSRSTFMPDVFVFPGGCVEPADTSNEALRVLANKPAVIDAAYVVAAARETFEECGLLFSTQPVDESRLHAARHCVRHGRLSFIAMLVEIDRKLDGGALHYFSHWITPPAQTRRFDTRFFVARAPAGQTARADAVETHDGLWISPRHALERCAAGTLALIFPTMKHLERIAAFTSIDSLLTFTASKLITTVMPSMVDEVTIIVPPLLEGVW